MEGRLYPERERLAAGCAVQIPPSVVLRDLLRGPDGVVSRHRGTMSTTNREHGRLTGAGLRAVLWTAAVRDDREPAQPGRAVFR